MVYILLGSVVLVFLMACNFQFDFRYGAEWTKLTKIPKNSVWRKIYTFKEKEARMFIKINNRYFYLFESLTHTSIRHHYFETSFHIYISSMIM